MNNVKTIEQAIQRAKEEAFHLGGTVAWMETKNKTEAEIKPFKDRLHNVTCALNLLGIMDFMPALELIHAEYWKGYENEQQLQETLARLEYLSA